MKRITMVLAIAMAAAAATPALADMPYFGATPKDGNWWNSPSHDYDMSYSYAKVAAQHRQKAFEHRRPRG